MIARMEIHVYIIACVSRESGSRTREAEEVHFSGFTRSPGWPLNKSPGIPGLCSTHVRKLPAPILGQPKLGRDTQPAGINYHGRPAHELTGAACTEITPIGRTLNDTPDQAPTRGKPTLAMQAHPSPLPPPSSDTLGPGMGDAWSHTFFWALIARKCGGSGLGYSSKRHLRKLSLSVGGTRLDLTADGAL